MGWLSQPEMLDPVALSAFIRAALGPTAQPAQQGRSEDPRRRRVPLPVLAGVVALLSIGLAAHLAFGKMLTAFDGCTMGPCIDETVRFIQSLETDGSEFGVHWLVIAVGSLTVPAVLCTWGLSLWGLGTGGLGVRGRWTSGRLTVLCLATLPIYYLLIRFAYIVYAPMVTIDYDMISATAKRPFALVWLGLLVLQSFLQLGFVLAQIGRFLLTRQWFAKVKNPA